MESRIIIIKNSLDFIIKVTTIVTTIATTMATTILEELLILNLEENSLTYAFVGISQIDYFSYNVYKSLHTRSIYVSPRIETFKLI